MDQAAACSISPSTPHDRPLVLGAIVRRRRAPRGRVPTSSAEISPPISFRTSRVATPASGLLITAATTHLRLHVASVCPASRCVSSTEAMIFRVIMNSLHHGTAFRRRPSRLHGRTSGRSACGEARISGVKRILSRMMKNIGQSSSSAAKNDYAAQVTKKWTKRVATIFTHRR